MHRRRICSRIRGRRRRKTILPDGLDDRRKIEDLKISRKSVYCSEVENFWAENRGDGEEIRDGDERGIYTGVRRAESGIERDEPDGAGCD